MLYPAVQRAGMPSFDQPLPGLLTILAQLAFFVVVTDTWFYWSHRLLHHRLLYRHVHKKHHEFKVPIGLSSEYSHPVEDIVVTLPSTLLGPFLVGPHVGVFWLWITLRAWEGVDGHIGYELPWSPWFLFRSQVRHDFHHTNNVGMYGAFFPFWDWINGTDAAFKASRFRKQVKGS